MSEKDAVRVEILGPIRVADGDRVQPLSPQLRRLVGILAASAGQAVSSSRLAEYVADGNTEGSTVRTAVSRVRKVLGDRLESGDSGYRLATGTDELDAARFEMLLERARSAPAEARVGALTAALALWRGRAFGELADEEWAIATANRLDLARAGAHEDLAATLIDLGRSGEAVDILEHHVGEHPYRERPVGLLMRALDASGRRVDALRAYQRFRTVLREDTGLDPSNELRDLESELLADAAPAVALPTGTVTFLFTDIEGSTERWANDEDAMAKELAAHDSVLRGAIEAHGGVVFKHTGDGVCAAFASASDAVSAAIDAQAQVTLPVRMGVHTGDAELRGGDYFGSTLNRAARIMDAGHGGQILLSSATAELTPEVEHQDLGEHRLRGLASPARISQVGTEEFASLRVATARKGNLPLELTPFVGRVAELSAVIDTVAEHRLVTLIGVGGTGKT
ncbi:MAG: BTAD domain-containing putative transcriptional regulator, partial [Ilumatobacteraceae bacterium]